MAYVFVRSSVEFVDISARFSTDLYVQQIDEHESEESDHRRNKGRKFLNGLV